MGLSDVYRIGGEVSENRGRGGVCTIAEIHVGSMGIGFTLTGGYPVCICTYFLRGSCKRICVRVGLGWRGG